MKVTVSTLGDNIFTLDVSEDLEMENFKAFCGLETGLAPQQIIVVFNGIPLNDDKKSLKSYGIKDGDVVVVQQLQPQGRPSSATPSGSMDTSLPAINFGDIELPGGSGASGGGAREDDPAYIRDLFLANPEQLAMLKQSNPRLAEALLSGDMDQFSQILHQQQEMRAEKERQRIRIMNADPFDTKAQQLIAEEIRQKNIEANMEAAMEYNPESFGTVVMLYINCKVNGYPVKAFIDSGAQTTIMSAACAERCHIMRLVDTRWAGVAKGVGTQKILGRVHMGQIQIEKDFLHSSFSILEEQPMDMLLGLDMLKRHQCVIDLKRNVLVIGTTNTETTFLAESQLPACARLSSRTEEEVLRESAREAEDQDLAQALSQSATESVGRTPSSTAETSNPLPAGLSEEDVRSLTSMGFSRNQVIEELQRSNGDKTQATAALFAKSLKF